MMASENVEIVQRMYDSFDRGDGEKALACFDPGVVTDASHRVDGRVGQGKEQMVVILAEWMDTWDDWSHEIEEIREDGEHVLVVETQRGRGKESGIEWEGRFAMLFELRGDKITRWTIYDSPSDAGWPE